MKRYLITGACESGIGEAITRLLLSDGHHVVGTHEPDTSIPSFSDEEMGRLELVEINHSSRSEIEQMCLLYSKQKFDGFINAQMFFHVEEQEPFDIDLWEKSIFVNLTMPTIFFRKVFPCFNENASVVLVSSTEAFVGSFGASAYASSKAAVHNLVKTWANISGVRAIRCNAVAAGWIGGVMDTDEVFNLSREITPLARLGDASEVASTVKFLIQDQSSFVNGSVLTVDGGYSGVDRISKFEFESSKLDSQ